MMEPNLVEKYPFIAPYLDSLGNPDQTQLVIGSMLMLVIVYIFKTIFLVYLSWKQASFTYDLHKSLSQQLFEGYLRQPYTFHLQRNTAQLIRNATSEVGSYTNAILAVTSIVTEALVLIGIAILLIAVQPVGALLVLSVLGVSSYAFHYLTKERILNWGVARQHHEGLRIQHLQQGLGSVKDIKVLGREEGFFSQYAIHNEGSANMGRNNNMLQSLPRLWLELLAILGLATLVLTMLFQNKPMEALVPMLGLFAAAAFRLMPSVNRIFRSFQKLRYALPSINVLYDELTLLNKNGEKKQSESSIFLEESLTLKHVSYAYPKTDQTVLNDINISIQSGTTVGFIGGSGSGKSTLIDIVLGLLPPSQGSVAIDSVDVRSKMQAWQNQIGYVPQAIYLTDDTLRRNIAFGLAEDMINEDAVRNAVRAAQLEDFVASLPEGLDAMVGERGVKLSGGQRQRIGIARALYHDPSVLILDEATSALDGETEKGVMQAINAIHGTKTILIVAHRLSTLTQCDMLYRLDKGKIIQKGLFDELVDTKRTEEVVERIN